MDKQQIFLANNIFDIDSALDRLEENLFTANDEKSPSISSEPSQQQKTDIAYLQQQQHHKALQEENGNVIALSDSDATANDDNKGKLSRSLKSFAD